MKKIIRIFMILIFFICVINNNNVYATQAKGTDGSGGGGGGSTKWTSQSPGWWKPTEEEVGSNEISKKANVITTAIRNIGIVVAVIALMVIGIRQMTASAEEKSILKESMPGYLLGVFMVVAVTVLPSLIYEITKQIKL